MATGAVKWFDAKKGYGFLTPDLGPRDVFVHVSALRRSGFETLSEGQRVEFELAQMGDGRLAALALRPAREVRLGGEGDAAPANGLASPGTPAAGGPDGGTAGGGAVRVNGACVPLPLAQTAPAK